MYCRSCNREVYECFECERYHHEKSPICDAGDMLTEEDVTEERSHQKCYNPLDAKRAG